MEHTLGGGMLIRVFLTAVFVVGSLVVSGRPAAACSVGPDWDRRAATEMFVLGRIVSVELRPYEFPPPKSTAQSFQKVVTMQVDLVLKGRPVSTVTFVDAGFASKDTVMNTGERIFSWGGGGDCSAIEEDPTGKYGAFALGRWNGELYSSILLGAAFGTDARDPAIAEVIERHGLSLPSTSTDPDPRLDLVMGGLMTVTVLVLGWRVRRRSVAAVS